MNLYRLLEPVAAASLTGEFGNIKLELLTRSKADGSAAHFETLIAAVKAQGGAGDAGTPRLGVITKDRNKIEVNTTSHCFTVWLHALQIDELCCSTKLLETYDSFADMLAVLLERDCVEDLVYQAYSNGLEAMFMATPRSSTIASFSNIH
jgi:hypothetical protein